ncbi:type II secretion system secretin GspD [Microbulbifer litoralis]|uniref:type II secretion system secretin GspD n=1 Tax=Microbulbifer litoralis TaxID=2933965 RepID=UPI002028F14D|nr:type II secretion system secretin GspD [Microbulbifer sp. GX H0434]
MLAAKRVKARLVAAMERTGLEGGYRLRIGLRKNFYWLLFPISLGSLAMVSVAVYAKQPAERSESAGKMQAQSREEVTLSLQDADIYDLIDWASDFTGKSIIVHPNVKGRVTVVAGDPMTREEAFRIFMSVLQVNGFALIEQGDTLKVVPEALAGQQGIPVVDGSVDVSPESLVVRTIEVQNISAAQLVALLRPLIPKTGHLAADAGTNTLILAERAANIDEIVHLVHQLDRTGGINIELVPLQFASAREVKEVLSGLLQSGGNADSGNAAQPLRIAVDERSNSLLLTGNPVTRQQLKKIVGQLDQPLSGNGNTAVIYMQYAKAVDLKPILEGMSGSIQKAEKDQQVADVEVSIQADEALNSLVLTAPPSLLEEMKGVVAKLDVRRAQVLIEALIVEVSESNGNSLGISWLAGGDSGAVAGFDNSAAETTTYDDDGNEITVTNPLSLATESLIGSGLNLGFISGDNLTAAINAVATESNANILSTPTIMALDNEEAEILVGQNVPFVTGETLTSGSDSDPFTTIQREDVGTTLTVTPRVNNNNSVTLELEQTVENVLSSSGEAADLVTSKREIHTKVLIDDGAILVLGGLMEDKVTETKSRVPLLGDIPGIGRLFRSTDKTVDKTNLMVFLRPRILSTRIAGYEETRKLYLEMQKKQMDLKGRTSEIWDWHRGDTLPDLPPPADN